MLEDNVALTSISWRFANTYRKSSREAGLGDSPIEIELQSDSLSGTVYILNKKIMYYIHNMLMREKLRCEKIWLTEEIPETTGTGFFQYIVFSWLTRITSISSVEYSSL